MWPVYFYGFFYIFLQDRIQTSACILQMTSMNRKIFDLKDYLRVNMATGTSVSTLPKLRIVFQHSFLQSTSFEICTQRNK